MKKSPALLAIGFILITFVRVSQFLQYGMQLGWLGMSFAIALTCGVYVSAYFTQHKETKWAAICSLVPFALIDMTFNTLEMIRTLAPEVLISPDATFMHLQSVQIEYMLQFAAVAYGVVPTLFAGLLGWLQAGAEKVASLNKRGWIAASGVAIMATFTKRIKATLEDRYHIGKYQQLSSGNSGKSLTVSDDEVIDADSVFSKVRWEDLVATDKTAIAGLSTRQVVSKWHVSDRTARNWKARVEKGE